MDSFLLYLALGAGLIAGAWILGGHGADDAEPSASYWRNVGRWLGGWARFGEVRFKPGWSARSPAWWAVYLLDYGAACLVLGIGVQPVSRWAGERMQKPWTWLADILNRLQPGHTSAAGPLLWNTQPCRRGVRSRRGSAC